MALPLLPLLGAQAIRLIGTHSLRNLAAKELFNLGESVLLKRVMPALDSPMTIGSNFIPGRSTSPGALLGSTPAGLGQILGKADVLMELVTKAVDTSGGMPAILNASARLSQLVRGLENNGNAGAFLTGLDMLKPSVESALFSSPALRGLATPILQMIDSLVGNTSPQQAMDNSQADASQQQTR